ncbi:DUF2512 family protein [Alkalibaculum sp. M08DMB]|uniref:DUF2512 family protein n=1 Tax=Alkalibaculum sporogenes TaxID=2655001 RepID=A0A6A7K597_9FIRM|nr:DUF2512 family protein [Alkalibaculum sporogenes]
MYIIKTIVALVIKFIITFIASWIAFTLIDTVPLSWITLIAVTVTIINYLLGHLLLLPSFGNSIAALGDGVIGAFTAYVISLLTNDFILTRNALVLFAVLIIVVEYFYYMYLKSSDKVAL